MGNKDSNGNRVVRCIKAPFRVLCKARDFYVRSMNGCAGSARYGNTAGYNLPRSFSVSSSRMGDHDEDFRELIRANSRASHGDKILMDLLQQQQPQGIPRSQTVAIGRIDEDKPCDFNDDFKLKTGLLYPRSKSYAVTKRTRMLV